MYPQIVLNPQKGGISRRFTDVGCKTVSDAFDYIRHLAYGRNSDKSNLLTVFSEQKGTCSTKHALLKLLLDEQGIPGFHLVLGIFMMGGDYHAGVGRLLEEYGLKSLPEAHNYLKFHGEIIDCTRPGSRSEDFERRLIYEECIEPQDITDYKVKVHQRAILEWQVSMGEKVPYTAKELWLIRERCILILGL